MSYRNSRNSNRINIENENYVSFWNGHTGGDLVLRFMIILMLIINTTYVIINILNTQPTISKILLIIWFSLQVMILIPFSPNLANIKLTKNELLVLTNRRFGRFLPLVSKKTTIIPIDRIRKVKFTKRGLISPYWQLKIHEGRFKRVILKFRSDLPQKLHYHVYHKLNFKSQNEISMNMKILKAFVNGLNTDSNYISQFEYKYMTLLTLFMFYTVVTIMTVVFPFMV